MPKKPVKMRWLEEVAKHDYAAAESYLGLLYTKDQVRSMMAKLRKARVKEFKAKDIFRASRLPLLGAGNSHVQEDEDKIKNGTGLSPLLLVRDQPIGRVVIADGYHRLCAIYVFNEDAVIRCQII
jgi:disulfide oxidoreductase YuzD